MSYITHRAPVSLTGTNITPDASRGRDFTIVAGAVATGYITPVSAANLVYGETVTVSDGITSVTFEFTDDNSPQPGNINIDMSVGRTIDQIATDIAAWISANMGMWATAADFDGNGDLDVVLVNYSAGTAGNVAITDTVTNAGFLVSGMSGGLAEDITLNIPSNLQAGMVLTWRIQNNLVSSGTITYDASYIFPGGIPHVLSVDSYAVDVVTGICFDGATLECSYIQNVGGVGH